MHKLKYVLLVCALLLSIAIMGFSGGCGDESAYHITWSPPKISTAISPGGSWNGSISFISNMDLGGAELSVVPELETFISVYPQSFSDVVADTVNTFQISIAVPHDTTVDEAYEGTISLTIGDQTCPETAAVRLYVAPSLETITEQSYNETIELEIEACNLFHESEQGSGTQEARRITLEFFNEQAEVFDAGISEDGDIWIVYKDGIHSLISTSPPGTLGSGYQSVDTEISGGALTSAMDYVTPGNKKAILLWPFCSDPEMQPEGTTLSDLMDGLSETLSGVGYEVNSVRDADVTVDLLKSLYSYGVVDFLTHGAVWSNQVVLMTGEEATFSSFWAHRSDWIAHRLARRTAFYDIFIESNWCIRPSFVTHYAAESYPNSLVVAHACSSLANYSMAKAFLDAGAYVYCGWSKLTYLDCAVGIDLFEYLAEDMSLQEAFSELDEEGATTCNVNGAQFQFYPSDRGDYKLLLASDVVTLTVSSTTGGLVTTPGEGSFNYNAGTMANLVATPDAGYQFVEWTGDVGTIGNVNAASTTITMGGDYSITANFEEEEAVYFPDANLEAAIRTAISKPEGPIYPSDLEGLTRLSAVDKNIANLTGLEQCTNLTSLILWVNQISDISPLANLIGLTHLVLGDNQISDISPLVNLNGLTELYLGYNQISNISPLANLTNLTSLSLDYNEISDVSPLANLNGLTKLYLDYNQISDISPLANLTNLTLLDLGGNQISNISPLANLTNLTLLDLAFNQQLSDISPLANLTNLQQLYIWATQISDISVLANLNSLTSLVLANNQISDISVLANLNSLTSLVLDTNQISDIYPLVDNPGLGEGDAIYLHYNPLSSDSINIYIPQLEARGVTVSY